MPFVDPPIKVAPLLDESPTSWITRICLKYHISLRDLISVYELKDLMKEPVNITANLSPLSIFLPEGTDLPNTVQKKIESFEWKKGRSDWLIYPNKKGAVIHNSYTQICPKCLREKGYYQLKWMLNIFSCCIECDKKLIERCPKCTSHFSYIKRMAHQKTIVNLDSIKKCHICDYFITNIKAHYCSTDQSNLALFNAYTESPPNRKYLEHFHQAKNIII